jgi:glycosyltransferase involved in cell wall biosynthesis
MKAGTKGIKICFIAPKAYPLFNPEVQGVFGGAEVDQYSLANELAKDKDFSISFITADYGQEEIETVEGVRIMKSLSFRENQLSGAIKVWRALRTVDAQIYFHEAASLGTFVIALFCRWHKRAFVYRTASQRECDGTYFKLNLLAGKAFRWSLRQAGQVIVQNEADKEALEQTMGLNSTVIPNAHHMPVLSEGNRDIILWVGRTSPFKRPELFIDLAQEFADKKFVMICQRATGDENYEALVTRANGVKNLEFIERVPFHEIGTYFQHAKVLVNTSSSEGFPNTFIQACKYATPILSLCVNPDDFLAKFECGICANNDWHAFVSQLQVLLKPSEGQRYGQNARLYAQETHDIRNLVDIYKELFRRLGATKGVMSGSV